MPPLLLTAFENSLTSFLKPGIRSEVPATMRRSGEDERSEMEMEPIELAAGEVSS
jgi:hypothetical protein